MHQDQETCKIPQYVKNMDCQNYEIIHYIRIGVIGISALALAFNVIIIFINKQYKFNTIRFFMLVQIFYIISLLSVTPHGMYSQFDICYFPQDKITGTKQNEISSRVELYNCLVTKDQETYSAVEGFVNLVFYALSYWFAVIITLYISLLVENNQKNFMRKKGSLIFSVIILMILWYLVPFILTFFPNVPFSFGPTGYGWNSQKSYFLYAGIVQREEESALSKFLVVLWTAFLPIALFIYHITLLQKVRKAKKKLMKQQDLSPRQIYIIKSGGLSFIIFIVQILNAVKLIMSLISFREQQWDWYYGLLYAINTGFDLIALVLVYIYFSSYYKQGRRYVEERDETLINSVASSNFASILI